MSCRQECTCRSISVRLDPKLFNWPVLPARAHAFRGIPTFEKHPFSRSLIDICQGVGVEVQVSKEPGKSCILGRGSSDHLLADRPSTVKTFTFGRCNFVFLQEGGWVIACSLQGYTDRCRSRIIRWFHLIIEGAERASSVSKARLIGRYSLPRLSLSWNRRVTFSGISNASDAKDSLLSTGGPATNFPYRRPEA